jgi:hypothetical protein
MPQTAGSNPEMLDQFGLDELPKATLTTQIQRRLAPKVEPQYWEPASQQVSRLST